MHYGNTRHREVERGVGERLEVQANVAFFHLWGHTKMQMRVGLALCVMLAMAVGRIKENQMEKMRSLVKAA